MLKKGNSNLNTKPSASSSSSNGAKSKLTNTSELKSPWIETFFTSIAKYFLSYLTNCLQLALNNTFSDFPHGVLSMKIRYPVNFQKGTTGPFILALMSYYNNYSLGSYLYLALHGTYGVLWITKDIAFPDRNCQAKAGFISIFIIIAILIGYWMIAWIQISGNGIDNPTPERIMYCIFLFCLGCVFMMVSDAQKYFTLMSKKGLIADGMFKYTRNPNYLGEMMLYSSFAVATGSYFSWIILLPVWAAVFFGRMFAKDSSLRQKEGAQELIVFLITFNSLYLF